MFPSSSKSKEPLLYDVRIKGTDHGVILLKGSTSEAPSVLLSGTIVLSVQEPIQIKNLSLRLYGKIRLNIPTQYKTSKGMIQRYSKYERRIYEHVWDNFNVENYLQNLYDNYGRKTSIASKSSGNLSSLPRKARSSTASLISLAGQSSSHYHTLVKGNYEFPFSAILPGSIPESVEGLPNASVVYKLEATIERNKFYTDLICRKHLRVVRTLAPDALELSETVAVDNTWPKKVEYSISIPEKAIAIGSATPIHILIIPLLKGLKLGPIKIQMVEHYQYCGTFGSVTSQERTVNKMRIKDPLNHMNEDENDTRGANDEDFEFQDRWEVDTTFHIPASLSKCTQDCTLLNSIKVRHKVKFVISLVNPDGHVSELRASLPVQLFISPFVALGVRSSDGAFSSAGSSSTDISGLAHNQKGKSNEENDSDDEVIFARSASELEVPAMSNSASATASMSKLMSPPNYGNHIYDRLWNDVSIGDTPPMSGAQTPSEDFREGSVLDNDHNFSELQMNLRRLRLEREYGGSTTSILVTAPVEESSSADANNGLLAQPIAANGFPNAGDPMRDSNSPLLTPNSLQLATEDPSVQQGALSPLNKEWEIGTLSRVPSYDKAMKSDIIGEDLPPLYPASSKSGSGAHNLERPQIVHHKSSPYFSNTSNVQRSSVGLGRSNNSSSTSLNFLPDNENSDNAPNPSTSSNSTKGQTANRYFSFGMTPAGSDNGSSTSLHIQRNSHKGALGGKSSSFSNLVGLLSKKDKK
ncbi:hypothetical protein HG536_0F02420 [Torulaspora globosa]|uniref:Arrestin C-terminal-like domain-containing protein n=1 Tax=Torulaspora globosa TaxID=48254 RepID=A0A7G3ZK81_9SACH|nr:uncharacterized protein HG536_0F02420 [Torulaspora globosa]QLL33917.1 hypothetical protein HG536_0F02420 [Torulaspora globosa]